MRKRWRLRNLRHVALLEIWVSKMISEDTRNAKSFLARRAWQALTPEQKKARNEANSKRMRAYWAKQSPEYRAQAAQWLLAGLKKK